jgi:hypothetical protein
MPAILLATDYPPLYVAALFLLALLSELAATGTGLIALVLGCLPSRSAQARRCSTWALFASFAGTILFFVSHRLDLQPEFDREALESIGWLTLPPTVIALAAFAFTHWRRG